METLTPPTPEELASTLAAAAAEGRSVALGGAFTKDRMGGPKDRAEVIVSTACLRRVLQYEPQDLTISVEAGLPFAELSRLLAENRQMVPLDPPFSEAATVGGVVASNSSGPRRRLYGTARDLIIGTKFATLEGKLVQSGGMVVKNVAGLDMSKLLVGSFGTLAAIAVVNFKLVPLPAFTRSFVLRFDTLAEAIAARDNLLRGVLQPAAVDLMNPAAASRIVRSGYLLLVQAGGNRAVLDRYSRALAGAQVLEDAEELSLWERVREFVPRFLAEHPAGLVIRVSSTLTGLKDVLESAGAPVLARAGSGIGQVCFGDASSASSWMAQAARREWNAVVEFRPAAGPATLEQWPSPGSDFAMMERIKLMFDPQRLLNRGRLYGRL